MRDAVDMQSSMQLMPLEAIASRIVNIRGQRVILDSDLAALYEIPTKRFNEAIKRNIARFPSDFSFQLDEREFAHLRSQFATSSWGGRRYAPRVFNEHGALMAATVLNSSQAVQLSVYVIRAFVKLRELAAAHQDFAKRLDEIEAKTDLNALRLEASTNVTRKQLKEVFESLRQLSTPPDPPKLPIGFGIPEAPASPKARTNQK